MKSRERIVAAMSGGVDSAVAAGLLVEAGHEVVGVTMKMYEPTKPAHAKSCCGADDFDDARRSAAILGISHYVLDYTEAFGRSVVDRFQSAYISGRTPNPCVDCNVFVKLGALRKYARTIDASAIATGHYARLTHEADGPHLYRVPHAKDQAYALAGLRPDQLAQLRLPLGGLTKEETRAHALRMGLPVHDKRESQDICFVEGGDYRALLPETPHGAFVDRNGTVEGEHSGITAYTVGQRAGLGGLQRPRYVVRIDAATNTIVLGDQDDLEVNEIHVHGVNIIRPEYFAMKELRPAMNIGSAAPGTNFSTEASTTAMASATAHTTGTKILAMIRSHAEPAYAQAFLTDDKLVLRFAEPVRAAAPGQLAVLLYPETLEVLASGTIEHATANIPV